MYLLNKRIAVSISNTELQTQLIDGLQRFHLEQQATVVSREVSCC
jgi:hypothetical protein